MASGLGAAPKYMSLACSGMACLGLFLLDSDTIDTDSPPSTVANYLSKCGVVVSAGLVACTASLTVFTRHAVTDALSSRPLDAVRIMRSAGGRVGACSAASMLALHVIVDGAVSSDVDTALPIRVYASFALCAIALPLTLPLIGLSYGAGWAVGGLIGRRMLEHRCTTGLIFSRIDTLHKSKPGLTRLLLGSAAVAAVWPYYYMHKDDYIDYEDEFYEDDHASYSIRERRDQGGTSSWVIERRWSSRGGKDAEVGAFDRDALESFFNDRQKRSFYEHHRDKEEEEYFIEDEEDDNFYDEYYEEEEEGNIDDDGEDI